MKPHRRAAALAALALACAAVPGWSQQYPSRPVRIVIPFPAAGGIDFLGRQLAQKLSDSLGQPFLVENRAGGNTVIGAELVARSAPDGHVLFLALDSSMTMNPSTYSKLPYDPVKDFAPISQLAANYIVIVGNPAKIPAGGLHELIAHAKANPGKLSFGSAGLTTQLIGEQLNESAGVKTVNVPYKGTAAVLPALLAGEIEFAIDGAPVYLPHLRNGKLRGLAMAAPKRLGQLPDLPTLRELGFPRAEMNGWLGLFAPAGTPRPVIAKLNAEIAKAWSDAQLRQKLLANGQDPVSGTPEELAALVTEGMAQWGPVIRALGIRFD